MDLSACVSSVKFFAMFSCGRGKEKRLARHAIRIIPGLLIILLVSHGQLYDRVESDGRLAFAGQLVILYLCLCTCHCHRVCVLAVFPG